MSASNLWLNDWSDDFVNLANIPADMQIHMRNAVMTSYYKYGSIRSYPVERMKERLGQTWKKFKEDGNHEGLVDAVNYCMFLYMLDAGDKSSYVQKAEDIALAYDEDKYKATDNGKGLKSVSDWLREEIYADS